MSYVVISYVYNYLAHIYNCSSITRKDDIHICQKILSRPFGTAQPYLIQTWYSPCCASRPASAAYVIWYIAEEITSRNKVTYFLCICLSVMLKAPCYGRNSSGYTSNAAQLQMLWLSWLYSFLQMMVIYSRVAVIHFSDYITRRLRVFDKCALVVLQLITLRVN